MKSETTCWEAIASLHGTTPRIVVFRKMYSSATMAIEAMTAKGIFRLGFLTSPPKKTDVVVAAVSVDADQSGASEAFNEAPRPREGPVGNVHEQLAPDVEHPGEDHPENRSYSDQHEDEREPADGLDPAVKRIGDDPGTGPRR